MTMIASVLHLERKDIRSLRITDLYSLHRVVFSLYEDVRDDEAKVRGQNSGILFADQGGDARGRRILMLSDRPPSQNVEGQYGQVRSNPIPDDFLDHSLYRFKVIVNPTRRDSASRKLLPVKGRESIGAWFCERAQASWGFCTPAEQLQVGEVSVQQFKDKRQNEVTICQAHVEGLLTVTDRAQFQRSFIQGIGRARAFGCGLLQIVPASQNPFA